MCGCSNILFHTEAGLLEPLRNCETKTQGQAGTQATVSLDLSAAALQSLRLHSSKPWRPQEMELGRA